MSTSTDGILFYGFSLEEDEKPWLDDEQEEDDGNDDWEDIIALKRGLDIPRMPYDDSSKEIYSAYWAAKRELIKGLGAALGAHCSGDYPIYFIYLKDYHYQNARGYVKDIPSVLPVPSENEIQKLREFCADLNIDWHEPGWKLVSYWG